MSCAAEWFVYGTGRSHWCCHVHEFNKWVLVQHSDVVRYFIVIVIFYCANTTAFHMPDWKFSEGGRWVKLGCKMGRRMKKVENHWFRGSTHFPSKNVGEPIEYSRCLPLPCFNKFVLTQKNLNCFVRYKTIPTLLCKDKRWCPVSVQMPWWRSHVLVSYLVLK